MVGLNYNEETPAIAKMREEKGKKNLWRKMLAYNFLRYQQIVKEL